MATYTMLTRLRVRLKKGVMVVRFKDTRLISEEMEVKPVRTELVCIPVDGVPQKVILNLRVVKSYCSSLIGTLAAFYRTIVIRDGGRIAMCNVDPALLGAFQTMQLGKLFNIQASESAALKSLQ